MNDLFTETEVKLLLKSIGEDPDRDGLVETPRRFIKAYKELFSGYDSKNYPEVKFFKNESSQDSLIIDEGEFFSCCEHHVLPFFGKYYFGYVPSKKIIGLSKIARIVDFFSSRLQTQERLTDQIGEHFWNTMHGDGFVPKGVILVMEAKHMCKWTRGVKKKGKMTTLYARGCLSEGALKQDFLRLCRS